MSLGMCSGRSAHILIIVCGIVGVAMLSAPVVADGVEELDGAGTAEEPYVVTNATELQSVADDPSATYVLGDDIDARATADWNGGAGFEPIGDGGERFTGSFDGNGHTISNLTIDRPDGANTALFGTVDGGSVTNVTLENASVTGGVYVGGLVGWNEAGNVSNVTVSGDVSSERPNGGHVIGALIGLNTEGTVSNSGTTARVSGHGDTNGTTVGGLVGASLDGTVTDTSATGSVRSTGERVVAGGSIGHSLNTTVSDSFTIGDVLGNGSDETNVGGLIGWNDRGKVLGSSATGTVTSNGTDVFVGGLVGQNDRGEVLRSSATGTVTGDGSNVSVGGLIGQNERSGVIKSAATGTVTSGGTSAAVGGLVGSNYQGMVFDSFATGSISDAADSVQRGGLVGSSTSATVLDSYWDSERTGLASSAGSPASAGLNTSQLTGATVTETTDLRVGETWVVTDGYPQLRSHVTNYTLALESTELEADETTAATVTLEFADGTTATAATVANYSSSDSGVATVENGTVEAVDDGEATITAELAGFSETVGLEVSASSSPPSFSPPSGSAPGSGSGSDSDSGQESEITVRDVSISETSVVEGDNVTVTAMLENTGDTGGERTISLLVDDEQVRAETVALSPGESTTVVLEHAVTETGSYTLSVADETFDVTVDAASDEGETEIETETETPTEDEGTETERAGENAIGTDDSVPGFGAVSAVLVLLSIGFVARRRR